MTVSAEAAGTTSIMPAPQLKVRSMSSGAISASPASQRNTGGTGSLVRSMRAASVSGSTRGRFSVMPPPVMWAIALTAPVACTAASSGFT